MLSKFKITSPGDSTFITRLEHNRKQNRTELIPLTEIYECERVPSSGKCSATLSLSPIYTSNFYMALFMWQFLFARVDDEK